jgi:hypothetical protein
MAYFGRKVSLGIQRNEKRQKFTHSNESLDRVVPGVNYIREEVD